MQRFFDNFDAIERFTSSLDYHQQQVECAHCLKKGQFVSHGILYKQRSITLNEPIGKRIFCSNRYGRLGCGRTCQLVVATKLPSFHYSAAHLFIFITSLLANMTVPRSYEKATGQSESRNAWRWLNKLMRRLSDYRCALHRRPHAIITPITATTRRLRILLPTLQPLVDDSLHCPCASWQMIRQQAFISVIVVKKAALLT